MKRSILMAGDGTYARRISSSPMPSRRVIDMWAPLLPTHELARHLHDHFPPAMLGYLRVFQKRTPTADSVRDMARTMSLEDDVILAALDAAGIERCLVT